MKKRDQIKIQEELQRIKLLENYDSNNPEKSKELLNEMLPAFAVPAVLRTAGAAFQGLSGVQKVGAIAGTTVGGGALGGAITDPGTKGAVKVATYAATGAMLGSYGGPWGLAIGAVIGGAAGAIMTEWGSDPGVQLGAEEKYELGMNSETWQGFDEIKTKEDLDKLEIVSSSEAEDIAEAIYDAMYGGGTDEYGIIDAINLVPSIVDLSRIEDEFGTKKGFYNPFGTFKGDLQEWFEDELTSGEYSRLKNQIGKMPLLIYDGQQIETAEEWDELLKEEMGPTEEEEKTMEFAELWKSYPCVLKTAAENPADWSDDFKQVTITIGEGRARFSNTGKYRYKGPQSDNKVTPVGTYSCSGSELEFDSDEELAFTDTKSGEGISESRQLSNILKRTRKRTIKEQNDISFGDMVLKLPKKVETEKDTDDDSEEVVTKTTAWIEGPSLAAVVAGRGVIRKGHKGDSVRAVQSILRGTYGTKTDGLFGAQTEADLKSYQKAQGLYDTGIVDQDTAIIMTGGGKPVVDRTKETVVTQEVATDKDEEYVNMITYDLENTKSELIDKQIIALNAAVDKQPTKQKCIQLIGAAAAGCKKGVKTADRNSLSQCYNSYNFGLNKVGRTGQSRRVKKCYELKGRRNV